MPNFEPTGDLMSDVQLCIDNSTAMHIDYVDRKGEASTRKIAPREIRGDRFYAIDLDKMGLRLFVFANVGSYEVLDETFDPEIKVQ